MQLKKIWSRHRIDLVALTCLLLTAILTEPTNAQEDQWVADTFNKLETLAEQNKFMPVINENPLDTEIPGGVVQLIMSLPVKVMGNTLIAGGG